MYFDSWSQFFDMGGYAAYVWSAFGITGIAMLLLVVSSLMQSRQLKKSIEQKHAREARRQMAKNMENTL